MSAKLGSLLLLFLALLFLLFLDDSSRHAESIVFLEIIVLMHVSSDQQFWIALLQLIEESIVDDWNLVDVHIGQLRAILNQ